MTAFFQNAHENCLLAFTQKSPDVGILQEVHQLYRRLNSSRWGDKLLPQFIARSETSFLAACRIVLGGQVVETYPLLRSVLEAALYGFYIVNKELHEVWVRRGESPETTKDARNVFTVKKILNALREENGVLAERAKKLYDLTIDYGAHPNSEGYLSTSQTGDNGVNVDYLMAGSLPWKIAVQETYKTGII